MQIITENDTKRWLSERGILDSDGQLSLSDFQYSLQFKIPGDSGKKTGISRAITSLFDEDEALFWINEFLIWPSCEDWNLFDGFRSSLGESSPLYEKPGHVFSRNDLENIAS